MWLFHQERGKPPENLSELSAMRIFQLRESAFNKVLQPAERIDHDTWETLGNPAITILGNSNIRPDQILLRPVDYQAIGPLVYPGRSAMFDFTDIASNGGIISLDAVRVVVERAFGKNVDRRNNLYYAALPEIEKSGYKVFYAPVNGNGLHVRLVWKDHVNLNYPVMATLPDIPEEARKKLISAFKKAEISKT